MNAVFDPFAEVARDLEIDVGGAGIRLLPDAGLPQDALLQVNCAKGRVPENEQTDGVKLTITGGRGFSVPVAGTAVLLLQRPMPGFALKRAR